MIFTEPEVTNCFNKIALVIVRENKTKTKICDSETSTNLATILKTGNLHCYNHLAVVIARENEVLDQTARAIFDITSAIFLIRISFHSSSSVSNCRYTL